MKYTPGPWYIDESYIVRAKAGGEPVCEIHDYGDLEENFDNTEANAQLIAAAPEMFDELRFVQNEISTLYCQGKIPKKVGYRLIQSINKVITKVKGGQ